MGEEGGDISSMDFAIVVEMTEDVRKLMRLDVKCSCHNLIPPLPRLKVHVALDAVYGKVHCKLFLFLYKAGKQ